MKNEGKKFEDDLKASIPDTCWMYRLRDNASSFAGGSNTRFASSNICDFILFDDIGKNLILIECKSTKGTSIPLNMIRENQISGLEQAGKHNIKAGFLLNFRNKNNDTFFIDISDFMSMISYISKKSFNINDLTYSNAVKVECAKKRTRYIYNIRKMIEELIE